MKRRVILLNPEDVSRSEAYYRLIGSRLSCAEIESDTAEEIDKIAKKSIAEGSPCDLTELFKRSPKRFGTRDYDEIVISNETFKRVLLERIFKVAFSSEDSLFIRF